MDGKAIRSRASDPWTSHAAARRVDEFADRHKRAIVMLLKDGPATIHELAARALEVDPHTALDHVAIARRMPEIVDAEPTGETRAGPNGRQCRVWGLR